MVHCERPDVVDDGLPKRFLTSCYPGHCVIWFHQPVSSRHTEPHELLATIPYYAVTDHDCGIGGLRSQKIVVLESGPFMSVTVWMPIAIS